MQCPKCNHIQTEAKECRNCGLIFAKYRAVQKRKIEQQAETPEKGSMLAKFFQLSILVIVVAGITYYLTRPASSVRETTELPQLEQTSAQLPEPQKPKKQQVAHSTSAAQTIGTIDNETPVEKARRATVSIETPWGTGSGFFVQKNYIVTNRHVVEFDQGDLEEIKEQVETNRRLIDLEQEKLAQLRKRMRTMANGPGKSQLEIIIKKREEYLAEVTTKQEKSEARLAQLTQDSAAPQIKIILSDGQEHYAGYMVASSNYDLALLALFSHDGSFLKKPPASSPIHQGDKVYTVGSPVGLRHTVTAGIFSGYRRRESDKQVFLQTDAAINPGNSGGPLIDENGFVRGVNTMILRDTEGIGFAIPIEKVYEEFNSTLQ